jgi:hypothetical protein
MATQEATSFPRCFLFLNGGKSKNSFQGCLGFPLQPLGSEEFCRIWLLAPSFHAPLPAA